MPVRPYEVHLVHEDLRLSRCDARRRSDAKSSCHCWVQSTLATREQAVQLREELLDIQYGRAEDRHGWMYQLV